jgi:CheY-like chemotaxis protein
MHVELAVDWRLRVETGLQVIQRLREREPGLPAVIVTGDTSPALLLEFAGMASSVVNKPVDGERLARALSEAVGR